MDGYLPHAYFDGEIIALEDAKVSVATHALQYGTGCFGGIRGYLSSDGTTINVLRIRDHFTRFTRSARLLKIALPLDIDGLCDLAIELTQLNGPTSDCYFRPFAYKAGLQLGPNLHNVADGFTLYMLPLGSYYPKPALDLMTSSWSRTEDTAIPSRGKISGSYVNASLAKDEADAHGFDDAIMLNNRGKVAEVSVSNFFMVRDGTLVTSPISADILEGITRRTVLELAAHLGITVIEREMDRTELYLADELLSCGTGVQIMPIASLDRRAVGDGTIGPVTKRLQDAFQAIVRGDDLAFAHWLTPVRVAATV